MALTEIMETLGSAARRGEYAGAETVLHFGSPAAELAALREACAVFDLSWRGKLVISGEDRVRWLNGMVTNNTRDLAQDCGNYSFVLNPQGRIQADLTAFQRGDFYMIETEAAQIPLLKEFFDRYIIMDDVEAGDLGGRLTSIGVGGPRAASVLAKAGLLPGEARPGQLLDGSWNGMGYTLVCDPIEVRGWFELWLSADNVAAFWQALIASGAVPAGAQALEWQRILLGLPRVGVEIGAKVLPQETGQEYALHHTKGCYIGQEIVERIHSRGQVHRLLTGLILDLAAPAPGCKVLAGGKEAGEIASSAVIPVAGQERTVALAYLRRDTLQDQSVTVEGCDARVSPLPFRF
ncbi:MAG: folate-binding protein [Acidobacteriota bacterium]|nr:folate-binding protein [Acidobacteriota bacterium]